MENSSNRLSSAKWSRNLNEDSQNEANRMRLLERQRQILETKLQRRQHQSTTTGVVSSRPATSISGVRARASRQASAEGLFDTASVLTFTDNGNNEQSVTVQNDLPRGQPPITPRARTSIAGSRTQAKLESPSSPTKTNNGAISQRVAGTVGSTITTNLAASTNRSMPIKSNLRDVRSLSRSEANITATLNTEPTKQAANRDAITPNPLTTVLTDEEMLKFVSQPISSDVTLQCTIIRDKKGLDRSLYPTYYMHLQDIIINGSNEDQSGTNIGLKVGSDSSENTATVWMSESVDSLESIKSNDEDSNKEDNIPGRKAVKSESSEQVANGSNNNSNRKVFMLSGRRRKKSKTYLIGNNAFDISRDKCLSKLKSNVLGTQFTAIRLHPNGVRYEIVSITYETNVLGFKGPRKMTIIIPKADEKVNVLCNLSLQEELKRSSRAITLLKNKTPIWNEETQSYVLNFHGRVTQASVKNFQLVVQESIVKGKADSQTEMRRSASSHQLRQRYNGNESSADLNDADIYDDDDEDEEEEEEENDDELEDGATGGFSRSRAPKRPNAKDPAKPISKTLSKSGYLMASSSEDAKNMATDNNELVSLQFGRVSNTHFSCDVSWPLSLLQAFAIALSSFDSKLACE